MSSFQKAGNDLYLVGTTSSEFGGSLYMKEICGTVEGSLPKIDYKKELALWELVIEANKKGLLASAKDLSSGGAVIALAKMAATSDLGCDVVIKNIDDTRDIYAESMSRAIIEVSPENAEAFSKMVGDMACEKIGTVGGSDFKVNDVEMSLADLDKVYFGQFKKVIEQDL